MTGTLRVKRQSCFVAVVATAAIVFFQGKKLSWSYIHFFLVMNAMPCDNSQKSSASSVPRERANRHQGVREGDGDDKERSRR